MESDCKSAFLRPVPEKNFFFLESWREEGLIFDEVTGQEVKIQTFEWSSIAQDKQTNVSTAFEASFFFKSQ